MILARITSNLRGQTKLAAMLIAGVIIGGGTAAVWASIPDPAGVIHACYRTNGGQMRIIDNATETCNGNETAVTWNQTGPQGPTGPAGPTGPQGPAGASGFVSNLVEADFSNASLQYRNMAGLDMRGARLTDVNAFGASLAGSNLSGASFQSTNLNKADMQGTNFSGAIIRITRMNNASLSGANFSNAVIGGGGFSSGFSQSNIQNTNFDGTKFGPFNSLISPGSSLAGGDFRGSTFNATVFGDIQISGGDFESIDFTNASFQANFNLSGANLGLANFSGLILDGVRLISNTAAGTNFTNVQFKNAQLQGTDMSSASLTGATWDNAICPDNTNSNDNGNTCIGHLIP